MEPLTGAATQRVLDALDKAGRLVQNKGADTWAAQCPAHDDHNPSLSLKRIRGMVLIHCRAGCETTDVVSALSLTMGDLFDDRRGVDYHYRAGGSTTRIVHRGPDKQFTQNVIDKRVVSLYLPTGLDLYAAINRGEWVYLPEGEKDADTLWQDKVPAVSAPMGAASWAKCDYGPLNGAKVRIVADKDEPGRKRAQGLAAHLSATCSSVEIVEAKTGKDAADHIVAGHSIDEFVPVPREAVDSSPSGKSGRYLVLTSLATVKVSRQKFLDADQCIPLGALTLMAGRG